MGRQFVFRGRESEGEMPEQGQTSSDGLCIHRLLDTDRATHDVVAVATSFRTLEVIAALFFRMEDDFGHAFAALRHDDVDAGLSNAETVPKPGFIRFVP